MNRKFSVLFIMFAFIMTALCSLSFGKESAVAENNDFLNIESKCAYLKDADSGEVLYALNETEHRPIASMCKIMTLLLTFEEIDAGNMNFDDKICVSDNAAGMGGSQVFLERNAEYKVFDLIKSIAVASANDASVAVAEKIAGSESNFVEKMNKKAESLNMKDTVFVNCTGLPKEGQYSCAKDVSVMFGELLKHKDYFDFASVWMDEIQHPEGRITQISNTNKLIRFYDGCDAGKTGYTSEAGHCVCCSAIRNDMRLISVVIKAPDGKTRFKDASSMFNYGFNNFSNKTVVSKNPLEIKVSVEDGKKDTVEVAPEREIKILFKNGETRNFEINFEPEKTVVAPLKKGDCVGKICVYENGINISTVNVISLEEVPKATFFDKIKNIVKGWGLF